MMTYLISQCKFNFNSFSEKGVDPNAKYMHAVEIRVNCPKRDTGRQSKIKQAKNLGAEAGNTSQRSMHDREPRGKLRALGRLCVDVSL